MKHIKSNIRHLGDKPKNSLQHSWNEVASDVNNVINTNSTTKQKITQKWNSSVCFAPETWWHVTSLKIDWEELFHDFFWDPDKPKGGMPYMFPNAGPLTDEEQKISWLYLTQHWFGRISPWKSNSENSQELTFSHSSDFPFSWKVHNHIHIDDESGEVTFTQCIENTSNTPLPLSTGLHPYFRIPNWDKSSLEFRFIGWEDVQNERSIWENGGTWKYTVPEDKKIVLYIPEIWEITLELSSDYKKFWVWSLSDKDFICIEPVMNDVGGIVSSPIYVSPGGTNINYMRVWLQKV